eukprot:403338849
MENNSTLHFQTPLLSPRRFLEQSQECKNLNCLYCCIEEWEVCGEELDCKPNMTQNIIIFSAIIAGIFFILALYCFVVHCCVGRKYRTMFIQTVLARDHQLKQMEKKQGVIIGLDIPKNIPVKIADMAKNSDDSDNDYVPEYYQVRGKNAKQMMQRDQQQMQQLIKIESAPSQTIESFDFTKKGEIDKVREQVKENLKKSQIAKQSQEQPMNKDNDKKNSSSKSDKKATNSDKYNSNNSINDKKQSGNLIAQQNQKKYKEDDDFDEGDDHILEDEEGKINTQAQMIKKKGDEEDPVPESDDY